MRSSCGYARSLYVSRVDAAVIRAPHCFPNGAVVFVPFKTVELCGYARAPVKALAHLKAASAERFPCILHLFPVQSALKASTHLKAVLASL